MHAAAALVGGQSVRLAVNASKAHAKATAVIGIKPSIGNVGEPVEFVVQTYDRYGNERTTSAEGGVRVEVIGSASALAEVIDRNDGKYDVRIQVSMSGDLGVSVLLDGESIVGSPLPLSIYAGKSSAEHSKASGEGLVLGQVGVEGSWTVSTADQYGNPTAHTADTVSFRASDANGTRSFFGQCIFSEEVQVSSRSKIFVSSYLCYHIICANKLFVLTSCIVFVLTSLYAKCQAHAKDLPNLKAQA